MELSYTERLDKIFDYLGTAAEKIGDVAAEQVPLVAREVVSLHILNGASQMLTGVVGLIILVVLCVIAAKIVKKADLDIIDRLGISCLVGLIASIFLCVTVGEARAGAVAVLKGVYAPRIVLIEYVRDAIKK